MPIHSTMLLTDLGYYLVKANDIKSLETITNKHFDAVKEILKSTIASPKAAKCQSHVL